MSYDFTDEIPEEEKNQYFDDNIVNWDERIAKINDKDVICCHDCRYFLLDCYSNVGRYHKICKDFEWW
jgi:hypothetical protein